jgi:Fic family protein
LDKYEKVLRLWQSYKIISVEDLDKYLNNFRILFAYNSGRIENEEITYHDTREIFENGKVSNYTGNPRSLFEQQNQKLCYELIKDKIICKEHISLQLVKEVHKVLTSGTYDEGRYIKNGERPGEFKKHDYVTGLLEVGTSAANVEGDLSDLINEVNQYSSNDILKVAAYLHALFEYIHPFADGNGRVGRILLNYYLMINNHPPLIVYDEDKRLYYEALQCYDEKEDLKPLYEFLKYQVEKTWENAVNLVQGISPKRKPLSDSTKF